MKMIEKNYCKECVIGIVYDYENTELVTYNELLESYKDNRNLVLKYPFMFGGKLSKFENYFDRRYSLNHKLFNYCPICGRKIDAKQLKNKAKKVNMTLQ